jgi:hypothetical protein
MVSVCYLLTLRSRCWFCYFRQWKAEQKAAIEALDAKAVEDDAAMEAAASEALATWTAKEDARIAEKATHNAYVVVHTRTAATCPITRGHHAPLAAPAIFPAQNYHPPHPLPDTTHVDVHSQRVQECASLVL